MQNIVDVEEFTPVVQSPEDGDFATGLSVKVGLQALANRTRFLATKLVATVASLLASEHSWASMQTFNGGIKFGSATGIYLQPDTMVSYLTPAVRTVLVPLVPFRADGWQPADSATTPPAYILTEGASDLSFIVGRNLLPSGAEVTRVRACCRSNAQVDMRVTLFTWDTSAPGSNNPGTPDTPATTSFTAAPAGQNFILTANMSKYMSNDRNQLRIAIDGDVDSGTALYWIEVQYNDPGFRNH